MTSCSSSDDKKYTVDKVVMTYVSAPLNIPSIIEKEQGQFKEVFEKLGLGFEYSDLTSGADQTAAMASGDIQILNAVGVSSIILAAANGLDIKILSMYSKAPGAFCMFANDDSIKTAKDLKGKTIAGPKGTNLHELLVSYLTKEGMSVEDVNFINMDIPSAVAALEGKSIDVALVGGTAAYNCEQSGKYKITDGVGYISSAICTAASKEFIDNNPEIIEAFLNTQKELLDYMNNNHTDVVKITAGSLGIEEDAIEDMMKLYDFNIEITDEDIKQLQNTEKFLYDNGMIEEHVDVEQLLNK